jgi:hypothetical protein
MNTVNDIRTPSIVLTICHQLKKEIEMVVKSGKLAHLVRDIKGARDKGRTPQQGADADKAYVDMIRRRVDDSSPMAREIKHRVAHPDWMKVPITFPLLEDDEAQDASLNILVELGDHRVAQIHVDGVVEPRSCMSIVSSG